MAEPLEALAAIGVVPVVELDDAGAAVELADALAAGGIGTAEITFRTAAAADAIRAIADARPGFLVGAGTVLSREAVDAAADAGASFLVSPGYSDGVHEAAAARGLPWIPGAATASEVQQLYERGYTLVKFFPAEPAGLATLKGIAAPFRSFGVRFVPTGGIGAENAAAYLAQPYVACVGGSWLAKRATLAERDFDAVTRLATEATAIVAGARAGTRL